MLTLDQMSVSSQCHFMPQVYSIDKSQIDEHLGRKIYNVFIFIYLFIGLFIDTDNAFQINHTDKSFHVFTPNLSDKNNWLSTVRPSAAA